MLYFGVWRKQAPTSKQHIFGWHASYFGGFDAIMLKINSIAYFKDSVLEVPARSVKASDTIGAGDTFMAGVLNFFDKKNKLSRSSINDITQDDITEALEFASNAASITVSRQGANPPWKNEVL